MLPLLIHIGSIEIQLPNNIKLPSERVSNTVKVVRPVISSSIEVDQ